MKSVFNKENLVAVGVVLVGLLVWQFVGSWLTKQTAKVVPAAS